MIHILSPAKSLDFQSDLSIVDSTVPEFLPQSEQLIKKLRTFSSKKLQDLMSISENLGNLNTERNAEWLGKTHLYDKSKQAIFRN